MRRLIILLGLLVVAAPAMAQDWQQIGQQYANQYGVPWDVYYQLIQGESGWNPNVGCNSSGACGIAQFIPSTARQYGVDVNDPNSSLRGAAQYLAALYAKDGSWVQALEDYSGGCTPTSPCNAAYAQAFADAQAADSGGAPPTSYIIPAQGQTIVTDQPGSSPGPGGGILDTIASQFQTATQGWQDALFNIAVDLFWLLAVIDLFASLIMQAMSGERTGIFDVVIHVLIRWLFPVLLFFWIMEHGSEYATDIINSLRQAGGAIGSYALTPSAVFQAGINIVTTIWNNYHGFWGTLEMIPLMIAAVPILISFALAAIWMLMILIESYFVIGLAVLILAFGALSWSRNIAITLLMACIAVGFKLLVIEAIAPLATQLITQIAQSSAGLSFQGIFTVLGTGVAFAALAKIIPDRIERIILGAGVSLAHPQQYVREAAGTAALAVGAGAFAGGSIALAAQAVKLAQEQLTQHGDQPAPRLQLASRAAGALAGAAGSEIGGRLGGLYRGGLGASATRMAGNLAQRRRVEAATRNLRPQTPTPPAGSGSE